MNIIVILSIIPVIIWTSMMPLADRFADLNSITTSLGQILGLVGMSLFSINLILAGRFKWLDKHFKGLDKVYYNHSRIGSIAFSMLLFHPLMLVVRYLAISTQMGANFFIPFNDISITWGIFSLLLMIILISFTFYIKFKYNIWKISHKFMTVAFFLGVIHTFMISSDVSRNTFLRYYILGLAFVALFTICRKAYFDYLVNNNFKYKVKNIIQLNKDILEIEMEAYHKKMIFTSGQFAFFSFKSLLVKSESHPFSISSSPNDNNLKITVKNLGDYTGRLFNLKIGDFVMVDGPYGNFSYKKAKKQNQIWIAGGIGITPFYSMAQSLESGYKVDLYYSVKENLEAVYAKELIELTKKNPSFRFKLWNTTERGYVNGRVVTDLSSGLKDKEIFLCGPSVFMESLKEQFVSLGVDIKKIHYENFNF